jgi:transposase-like protein
LGAKNNRNGRFSTEIFERYQRSEKALVAALTEMYIGGSIDSESQSDQRRALRTQF